LQLIQKLKPNDPAKRLAFCEEVLGMMERDEDLSKRIIFSEGDFSFIRKGQQAQYPDMGIREACRCGGNGT
jgi:hypothetical protein